MAKMFIGGESVESVSNQTYEICNPATNELVDVVQKGNREDAKRAIDAADDAFKKWRNTSIAERCDILFKGIESVRANIHDLGKLLCAEQGKPVKQAETEIEHFLHGMTFYARLGPTYRGSYVPLPDTTMYGMVLKQPMGVCAAISPWNFPITLMGTKIGPALVAGNTVIHKPASTTPLTATRIIELLNAAGLPPGVLNIVTGPGGAVGEELISNPKVRRVAFTGQSDTGQRVAEIAGRGMKRITLELGGSDPLIICDDADLKRAEFAAWVGRFFNCGQACLAVKRLYVFDSIYDEFVTKLVARVQKMKVGNGTREDVFMGPLHTAVQREEVENQIADAVNKGARVLTGNTRPQGAEYDKGYFISPTLLADVPLDSKMVTEEVFGPALPIWRVKDLDHAIEMANGSIWGLGASIITRDLSKARYAAENLQAGNVWVNSLHVGYDEMPFGGTKMSGIGREHGPEALEYYLETKGVVIATS
ncbi:MAG: aldehyde dehydrogenase [Chloroflexi bacterium]|nr:aldehyde dehydrogenase [Chloroflexota bacterium]